MLPNEIHNRYQTQMQLPEFGLQAQQLLEQSKILIIGAGGLGCPCMQYLVAAGTGHVTICDGDVVEISNLHRQILFTTHDIGRKKTEVAKERLKHVNPAIEIKSIDSFIDQESALQLFPLYDVIIDCTDDIRTRFLINDACVLLHKPLVYGAVFQFEAQLAVFTADTNSINLRDVFHELNTADIVSCEDAGALGAITGLVGTMQALEAIKYVIKSTGLLQNEMLICNFLSHHQYKVRIPKSLINAAGPETPAAFLNKRYQQICQNSTGQKHDLDQKEFLQKIKNNNVQIIDVRNRDELPVIDYFNYEQIPLQDLLHHPEKANREKTILLFCHAGIRSQTALEFLLDECNFTDVYHLKGGLLKWIQHE